MKLPHIRIAIAVLIAVLAVVIWSTVSVHRTLNALLQQTEAIRSQQAHDGTEILVRDWETCAPKLRMFLQNDALADLNEAILRLPAECASDADACQAELAGIAADLRWLEQKHVLLPI